ncbi:MAG: response regulator transcription factor [Vulcanimicrobiota bacterium]
MKILIAEDDFTSRRILEILLLQWGYEVIVTSDGSEAWEVLQKEDAPPLVILDWMMPGKDGREICSLIRGKRKSEVPHYVILLTSKSFKEDIVTAFDAGADDYITKPFDREELKARIKVGERIVSLQTTLAKQVKELQEALNHIKTLQGILPICSYCKKIRDDGNYWQLLENYISTHSMAQFSHSICPDCYQKYVEPDLEKLLNETQK